MTCLPREGSLMIKKSGNIANTGLIPQAKTPSQGAKIQVPTINGRRNILSQIDLGLTNAHREPAPRIPKFSPRRQNEGMFRAGSKTIDTVPISLMLTTARQNGRITHEKILGFQSELMKTTALRSGLIGQENVIPKIMTTASRSGLRNLAVSTSRQKDLKAKIQQHQKLPKYCQSGRIPERTRQSAVPQLKNHTRGQESHKEWAVEVFHTKKHKLRHQTKLDQSRVGERRADYRSRQQNLSRDHPDNPTKGPLGRCVQNQAPIIGTPRFHTGRSHPNSVQIPNSVQPKQCSQPTRISKGLTRLRNAQHQTKSDPSAPVMPDSINAEIKPPRHRRWNISRVGSVASGIAKRTQKANQ
ncbi:hypothetical protein DdX_12854 [Ditylenchus destructor]|uniref:Uncharacterized protein n=1 Tax=Ditylenchus destructor TaxID=166010 RepID=A0AAD4MVI9_9BILA|nr:hypothetical protein DdX_12854 [Ditylenchus destructor]